MKNITVGYLKRDYPNIRNIIDKVEECNYKKIIDIHRLTAYFLISLQRTGVYSNHELTTNEFYKFNDFNLGKVDIFHFFNNVSFGKTPWISTFETVIPRFTPLLQAEFRKDDRLVKRGLEAIAKDSCKKIIAISDCTLNIQRKLLQDYPYYINEISEKICVIHPPQELILNDIDEKVDLSEELSFIFVGNLFFQKGGLNILEIFTKIKLKYKTNIRLTIISRMVTSGDITKAGNTQYLNAMSIIEENKDWIKYYNGLPNNEVVELIKKAHIGLLPTWADTYGYSVLEFQAAGCPVISTDVRALPEINNNDIGWMINLPKNDIGETFYSTEEQRMKTGNLINEQLENILVGIIFNLDIVKIKAKKSLNKIRDNHSLNIYGDKLSRIYKESL